MAVFFRCHFLQPLKDPVHNVPEAWICTGFVYSLCLPATEQRISDNLLKAPLPTVLSAIRKLNSSELAWTRASDSLAEKTLVMPDEVHRSHTDFGAMTLSMERVLRASHYVALTGIRRAHDLCCDNEE